MGSESVLGDHWPVPLGASLPQFAWLRIKVSVNMSSGRGIADRMRIRPLIGIPTQTLQAMDGIPDHVPESWVMSQRYFHTVIELGGHTVDDPPPGPRRGHPESHLRPAGRLSYRGTAEAVRVSRRLIGWSFLKGDPELLSDVMVDSRVSLLERPNRSKDKGRRRTAICRVICENGQGEPDRGVHWGVNPVSVYRSGRCVHLMEGRNEQREEALCQLIKELASRVHG